MNTPERFGAHRLKAEAKEMIDKMKPETLAEIAERLTTEKVNFTTIMEHHPLVAAHMIRMAMWESMQNAQKTGS